MKGSDGRYDAKGISGSRRWSRGLFLRRPASGRRRRRQPLPSRSSPATDRQRILAAADKYLSEQPVTVTASQNQRSAGGLHDYSSEGDYWWPDPKNPGGPYIQRDGMSNPDNFNAHREAMVRLSLIVPALAAAWELTGKKKYSDHAGRICARGSSIRPRG